MILVQPSMKELMKVDGGKKSGCTPWAGEKRDPSTRVMAESYRFSKSTAISTRVNDHPQRFACLI
jgi:hypothetical protein